MRSYHPEDLFDEQGHLFAELAALAPKGDRRMGANPHANGGKILVDLDLPDIHQLCDRCAKASDRASRVNTAIWQDDARHFYT